MVLGRRILCSGQAAYALFIGRYVRSLEYAHEPGMLFFKMEDGFLREIARG